MASCFLTIFRKIPRPAFSSLLIIPLFVLLLILGSPEDAIAGDINLYGSQGSLYQQNYPAHGADSKPRITLHPDLLRGLRGAAEGAASGATYCVFVAEIPPLAGVCAGVVGTINGILGFFNPDISL